MAAFDSLKIQEIHHVEFAVADLEKTSEIFLRLGFEKVAVREIRERKLRSALFLQNQAAVVVSQSALSGDPVAAYVAAHGDGVYDIAFRCEDAVSALEIASKRGAETAEPPKAYKKDFGSIQQATIRAFGSVRHSFISGEGSLFAEGFDVPVKLPSKLGGVERFDALVGTVEREKMGAWVSYYQQVFGLETTVEATGIATATDLSSVSLRSPNGAIKILLCAPSEEASSLQEFLQVHHGAGFQGILFSSSHLPEATRWLRNEDRYQIPSSEESAISVMTRPLIGALFFEIQASSVEESNEARYRNLLTELSKPSVNLPNS